MTIDLLKLVDGRELSERKEVRSDEDVEDVGDGPSIEGKGICSHVI